MWFTARSVNSIVLHSKKFFFDQFRQSILTKVGDPELATNCNQKHEAPHIDVELRNPNMYFWTTERPAHIPCSVNVNPQVSLGQMEEYRLLSWIGIKNDTG